MKESFGRLEFECGIECEVKESVKKNQAGAEIHTFLINWDYEKVEKDTEITIQLKEDAVGHMYYDYKNIPINFELYGCEGNLTVNFTVKEKSGFRVGEIYSKTAEIASKNGTVKTTTCNVFKL